MTDLDRLIARLRGSHNESDHAEAADAIEQIRAELALVRKELFDVGMRSADVVGVAATLETERDALRAELAETREKAIKYDLDAAGIEHRTAESVELVELRAELAECKADAERWRIARRDGFQDVAVVNRDAEIVVKEDADAAADAARAQGKKI